MVGDARFAMLTSLEKDGVLRSRLWGPCNSTAKATFGFLHRCHRQKLRKRSRISKSTSYVRADKHDYLSVSGAAELVDDKEKMQALWSPWIRPWFPKGLDDPDLALLKVSIMEAEYWDAPDSATARAYGLVKALATGDTDALGEHRKIDVKEE